jgi:2-polyprenyl-6-methoxyphenol hydroxylase-like FAD-dependent oxidoreductase
MFYRVSVDCDMLGEFSPSTATNGRICGDLMSKYVGRQAVVIGAGMGGLSAARALAEHFEQVVVIENDALPAEAAPRPGTPQCKHVHGLLMGGLQALDSFFPGFEQVLLEAGAVPMRLSSELRYEVPGYDPFPQRDLGLQILCMTRPLIEATVRKKIAQHGNISLRECCKAQELVVGTRSHGKASGKTGDNATEITGVRCGHGDGRVEDIAADFVVDASSHGLLTLNLLGSLGLAAPAETTIGVDIGYCTAMFGIPDDAPTDWKGMVVLPQPPHNRRGAFILPAEGGRWVVTLAGRYGDKPPDDEAGFFAYVKNLRTPTAHNALRSAKRQTGFSRYGLKASRRRHFESVTNFPHGLLPFGDTICRFNPIYGQGMSVAAKEACLLRDLLAGASSEGQGINGLAATFLNEAQKIIETPWSSSAIPDYGDPLTEGPRPPDLEKSLKFGAALFKAAAADPAVHKVMSEVQHLLRPGSAYQNPEIADRIKAAMAAA